MRLSQLTLENFRSCRDVVVDFAEYMTLLVGENDAGKSNLVDALRLAVSPASARPTIYFDTDRDLSYGLPLGSPIRVRRRFTDLTDGEQALLAHALVDEHGDLVHATTFRTESDLPRRRRLSHAVGDVAVTDPEPELRDRIAHVYLPPLRDAARALDSADGNRIADIVQAIASDEEIDAFEQKANSSLRELATSPVATKVVQGVQEHLTSVTQPVRHRVVGIEHRDQRMRRLARSLRLHMAAEGLTPTDLVGSGLGYANLLYIATVVLELARAPEFDLTLLLVEEPEAHLHPQLQSVLLSYLLDQAKLSAAETDPASMTPAGRIQVIATTHSPLLASSVSLANVVVLRSCKRPLDQGLLADEVEADGVTDGGANADDDLVDAGQPVLFTDTACASLAALNLPAPTRRKVDRYLNATRASMLFARQIMLVEGIAESMLLRTLAERIVFASSKDTGAEGAVNRLLREQFRAITILAVDGVDFMPYLEVLLGGGTQLCDRLVVVTDGDNGAGDARKKEIEDSFPDIAVSGDLVVVVGATTFEAELYSAVGNEALLRSAFLEQHPRSGKKWDELCPEGTTDAQARAAIFSKALKDKDLDLGKGDFAHVLANLLDEADGSLNFDVPAYLELAIRSVTIAPAT